MPDTYHLQLLRGTTQRTQAYTGLEGELVYNTQAKNLWIHDGTTRGGNQIASLTDIPTRVSQLENDMNYASTAPGSSSADSAIHDQNGNVIHQYYAPINNPKFTGTVTVPTPDPGVNNNQAVNGEWVSQATCVVHTYGNETISGTKTFNNVINGTSIRAQWADLAENYLSDRVYEAGTLIAFGGESEVTVATTTVNGVVSENPGYLLNNKCQGTFVPVALCGRVNVLVKGVVKKFDKLVLDKSNPGIAIVDNNTDKPIARALQSNDDHAIKKVLCATLFTLD